ncbi:hypothetical protein [Nitrosovibrio sp. Nv4]|uniref:hypothetical protein n=1 Tax=Nitrosovibrio sp. Nv4 TaxID=1945880 RepID=UPI000BC7D52E|nr:hypothetical protein [Nitrosovibrio sp. Nv4]SOD41795.1 hypothetical protein SAMN06298226_2098 [Nitrosovibrio sp. Nv4]
MKFRNPEHALRWAYETTNRPIVKISSVNAMRGPDRGGETGADGDLTAYDRHAQAALILGLCERVLSALHMAYVTVQYGREASGFDLLARHLAANFGTGMHSRRGVELIIRTYCGQKTGLREIRKNLSCGMLKAASLRNRGYDALDMIHNQAMDILQREMEARDLLQSSGHGPAIGEMS